MEKQEIFNKLQIILSENLKLQAEITENTALLTEKIIDSLDFMNYLTSVEETFDISISDEDVEKYQLGIVKNMVEYLSK